MLSFFCSIGFSQTAIKDMRFEVTCEILDQTFMQMDEGKSKRTNKSPKKNGENIGDKFSLKFNVTGKYALFTINPYLLNQEPLIQFFGSFYIGNEDRPIDRNDDFFGINSTSHLLNDNYVVMGSKRIYLRNNHTVVSLTRYYKNDWNFTIQHWWTPIAYTATANCMDMPTDYDEMLESRFLIN